MREQNEVVVQAETERGKVRKRDWGRSRYETLKGAVGARKKEEENKSSSSENQGLSLSREESRRVGGIREVGN